MLLKSDADPQIKVANRCSLKIYSSQKNASGSHIADSACVRVLLTTDTNIVEVEHSGRDIDQYSLSI